MSTFLLEIIDTLFYFSCLDVHTFPKLHKFSWPLTFFIFEDNIVLRFIMKFHSGQFVVLLLK